MYGYMCISNIMFSVLGVAPIEFRDDPFSCRAILQ